MIVTTHSPLLVRRELIGANAIVRGTKIQPAKSLVALRDVLGIDVGDDLASADFVLLVEGQSDVQIVPRLFECVNSEFHELLKQKRLLIEPLDGASNISARLAAYRANVANPILITDDDKAGRDAAKKAIGEGQLDCKYVFKWARPDRIDSEIEDFIKPEVYWLELCEAFCDQLSLRDFKLDKGKWTTRMSIAFKSCGKPWDKTIAQNVKNLVAAKVSSCSENAMESTLRPVVKRIADSVTSISLRA